MEVITVIGLTRVILDGGAQTLSNQSLGGSTQMGTDPERPVSCSRCLDSGLKTHEATLHDQEIPAGAVASLANYRNLSAARILRETRDTSVSRGGALRNGESGIGSPSKGPV